MLGKKIESKKKKIKNKQTLRINKRFFHDDIR